MSVIIENRKLSNLINELEKNVNDITDIIKKMNISIRTLNDDNWQSKEKNKLDDELLPFISHLDDHLLNYLMEPVNLLKNINQVYSDKESDISKNIDKKLD